ncbi:MAG: outer membrane beta-barrel protein [Sulfitobacter sp.]
MTRLNNLALMALTLGASMGAAVAGSPEAAVDITPSVSSPRPPPPPANITGDWTGFYTGLQLGYADADGDGALDGNDTSIGFHAGYDYDLGSYVIGAELDYDQLDLDLNGGAASVDSVARLKVKGGYDLGKTLIYATAGFARADTSVGDETGGFAGIGVNYRVSERYTIGAEVLEHRFDDSADVAGNDLDATTITLRGALRF